MKEQRPLLGEPPAGFDEDQLKYPDPDEYAEEVERLISAKRRATAVYYSNPLVSADMIEEALKENVKPWQFVSLSPIVHSWLSDEEQGNVTLPDGTVAYPLRRIQELARLLVLIGAER